MTACSVRNALVLGCGGDGLGAAPGANGVGSDGWLDSARYENTVNTTEGEFCTVMGRRAADCSLSIRVQQGASDSLWCGVEEGYRTHLF